MFLEIIIGLMCLYIVHYWLTMYYDHFEKRGIPYKKPRLFFGSVKDFVLKRKNIMDTVIDLYNEHPGRYYGFFAQRHPILLIRDPDLIKQITIKDFDHFVNHRTIFKDEQGQRTLLGSSLFTMENGRWKDMRSHLSPIFTGSKMRLMFEFMNKVAHESIVYLQEQVSQKGGGGRGGRGGGCGDGLDLELRSVATRYINDIIASTAFGFELNSFQDEDNEFYQMAKQLTNLTALGHLRFVLYINFNKLMKRLGVQLFSKETRDYFVNLVTSSMKYRKEHDIKRPDLINVLMEIGGMLEIDGNPKIPMRQWTETELAAQSFLFFFAGYENTARAICLMSHELMENPDIQEKLLQEVDTVSGELKGKQVSYETLINMKYMDAVLSETNRKWGGTVFLDRLCNKDITYNFEDGQSLSLKKGDALWVPVIGLHRDPKYYQNPEKFDPERFSEENKDKIQACTYLPFGTGPRNCLASRFALIEVKLFMFYVLQHFRIEVSKRSSIPIKLYSKGFQINPKDGYWFKFVPRHQEII